MHAVNWYNYSPLCIKVQINEYYSKIMIHKISWTHDTSQWEITRFLTCWTCKSAAKMFLVILSLVLLCFLLFQGGEVGVPIILINESNTLAQITHISGRENTPPNMHYAAKKTCIMQLNSLKQHIVHKKIVNQICSTCQFFWHYRPGGPVPMIVLLVCFFSDSRRQLAT